MEIQGSFGVKVTDCGNWYVSWIKNLKQEKIEEIFNKYLKNMTYQDFSISVNFLHR